MSKPLLNITYQAAILFACFLVLYEFSTYMANDMIMPGMLQVIQEYNAPNSYVATSLTAYMLGGCSLQLFLGPLSDRYGRRPVMLFGVILFLLFTVLLVLSNSIETFIAARYFQGMGMCFITVGGYAVIQEVFEEMDAVRITSLMANVALIAPLIGPLAGAMIIHYYNWRIIFIAIAIFAVIALGGLWKTMPETVGATLTNGKVIAKVPLKLRVVWQNYLALFKNKTIVLGTLAISLSWLPLLLWIAVSPLMVVTYGQQTVLAYGYWQIPIFTAVIMGNFVLHHLSHKKSLIDLLMIGVIVLLTSVVIGTILLILAHGDFRIIVLGLSIYGLGLGISNGPLFRLVLFSTEVAKGTASAFMNIFIMALLASGIQLVNVVYSSHNNYYYGLYSALAITCYWIILAIIKPSLKVSTD